jgi:K+-sensing histidine kinase KdpD
MKKSTQQTVMETKYAPAERLSINDIEKQLQEILSASYVTELLQALPYIATILNENRQIIFANDSVMKLLGYTCLEDFIGKRPGELISCINSDTQRGGCGTSENCSVCGAVNTILQSQKNNEKTVGECRISSIIGEKPMSFDFLVAATPLQFDQKTYTLFTINDISSDKRRRMLERIFFHDILNISGSIEGVIDILKTIDDTDEIREMINMAGDATRQLNEEIITQRELLAAENHELKSHPISLSTAAIIELSINSIKNHQVAEGKNIEISLQSENLIIQTDKVMLTRVLVNMIKNALEASPQNIVVEIGCKNAGEECVFWVHNQTVIPHDVQLQIFQRSFSTKGEGRGIGTYSMKILTENYLGGKIWFASSEDLGTTFFVGLPL